MYDEKLEMMIKDNPSLEYYRKIAETEILVISPNVEKYKNDPQQIYVPGNDKKSISKQFIIDMITYDDSFEKIMNNPNLLNIIFIGEKGEFKGQYRFNRMELVEILKNINIEEFPLISDRYNQIMDTVSYRKYKEKMEESNYKIEIEGIIYNIPSKQIFDFLELDNDEFDRIIINGGNFNDIPLPHFIYSVIKYFEANKLLENYIISDKIKSRIEELKSSKHVDIEMLNEYLDCNDSLHEQITINSELENSILSDIPSDFSDLEKAIYVYIKMCKLLTYDEEFYVVNQTGPLSQKHKFLGNISNISLSNNKVVCYEFNVIFSYFLSKFNINFINYGCVNSQELLYDDDFLKYGNGHMFLKFRCGKYLVKADSVTAILQGDIMQAKLNQPLQGLVCENNNEKSRNEFSIALTKVYNYIAEREPKISQNKPQEIESFDDIVSQFISTTDKVKAVSIEEKMDILIKKINCTKMCGIDAYSYLLQLRKILFTSNEQKDNIKISIIRQGDEKSAEALAIISTRLPNEDGKMSIKRYIFIPGRDLIPIAREELQKKFDDGFMGYISDNDPIIPGIKR